MISDPTSITTGTKVSIKVVGQDGYHFVECDVKTPIKLFLDNLTKKFKYFYELYKSVYISSLETTFTNQVVNLIDHKNLQHTLEDIGITHNGPDTKYTFELGYSTNGECPTETEAPPKQVHYEDNTYNGAGDHQCTSYTATNPVNFVGLVNQAMTCYLNSLIQALFMTPEFRNAVYSWKFEGSEDEEEKSITYQLQKLFLSLQTSTRAAVETIGLTKSFGWDSREAWQQHDIQELCRVMFDALEQQFKDKSNSMSNNEQSNLINNLYQGKMMDYVKCLECGTENSREDTFLDIPLPVRPFGSTIAYGDILEALQAFVKPETLDGNNQYFCEKCAKKCDAHKGLKFKEFPYLLTLHLMRFDFDYNTMHRIKLNDKVTFPNVLNLNSFNMSDGSLVYDKDKEEESEGFPEDIPTKCDDSSTTDSGSALDEENGQEQDAVDIDEGIDISNHQDHNTSANVKGPYVYELFSIMIHSGSASGGHYYAYIKDFSTDLWYCFNDESVTRITDDDISKTFGGGPSRGYYSGAYSSSTNAYMLMYRQIDKQRNVQATTKEDFPQHIQELHVKLQEKEEIDKERMQKASEAIKVMIRMKPPNGDPQSAKIIVSLQDSLQEVTSKAYNAFNMKDIAPIDQCRLIKVNPSLNSYEPLENRDDQTIGSILSIGKYKSRGITAQYEMLLEYKEPNESYKTYVPGSVKVNMFLIDTESGNVQGPTVIKTNVKSTVQDLKKDILTQTNTSLETPVYIVIENIRKLTPLVDDNSRLDHEGFNQDKIYVTFNQMDPKVSFEQSTLCSLIKRISNTIRLTVQLPDIDHDSLSKYRITEVKKYISSSESEQPGVAQEELSPTMLPLLISNDISNQLDQSTSEDSSLTDSERTLMGDDPDDCRVEDFGPTDAGSAPVQELELDAPSTQVKNIEVPTICLNASSNYSAEVSSKQRQVEFDDGESSDTEELSDLDRAARITCYKYFKVLDANFNPKITIDRPQLMIEIDKRTTVAYLMKHLEPYVRVPCTNFCVCTNEQSEIEHKNFNSPMSNCTDGEVITIKLKRILQEGEYQVKIYKLQEEKEDPPFLMELIISKGQLVKDLKTEVVEELNKKSSSDLQVERCRLREKTWRRPGKILLDNQTLGDEVIVYNNYELFLQEIDKPEIKTDDSQTVLTVRRFHPDTEAIDKAEEIVLDELNLENFKTEISKLSGIPVENIDSTQVRETSFTVISDLDLSNHVWNKELPDYVHDGQLFVYCDNRTERKQTPKQDNSDETNQCKKKTWTSSYVPRKEKALKIVTQRDITPVTPSNPD